MTSMKIMMKFSIAQIMAKHSNSVVVEFFSNSNKDQLAKVMTYSFPSLSFCERTAPRANVDLQVWVYDQKFQNMVDCKNFSYC